MVRVDAMVLGLIFPGEAGIVRREVTQQLSLGRGRVAGQHEPEEEERQQSPGGGAESRVAKRNTGG